MGDPCHDWENTAEVCEWLHKIKQPIIVTKHWRPVPDGLLERFMLCRVCFNTSVSALDTEDELSHRLNEWRRLSAAGIKSILRIVSCKFGDTETGRTCDTVQRHLFELGGKEAIDNPLRISLHDKRVIDGEIIVEKRNCGEGLQSTISIVNP
jgi:hypothetical protein